MRKHFRLSPIWSNIASFYKDRKSREMLWFGIYYSWPYLGFVSDFLVARDSSCEISQFKYQLSATIEVNESSKSGGIIRPLLKANVTINKDQLYPILWDP